MTKNIRRSILFMLITTTPTLVIFLDFWIILEISVSFSRHHSCLPLICCSSRSNVCLFSSGIGCEIYFLFSLAVFTFRNTAIRRLRKLKDFTAFSHKCEAIFCSIGSKFCNCQNYGRDREIKLLNCFNLFKIF